MKTKYRITPKAVLFDHGGSAVMYMPQFKKWWWFRYKDMAIYPTKTEQQAYDYIVTAINKPLPSNYIF